MTFGKRGLKLPTPRGTGANYMSRKHRTSFIALLLIAAAFITSASAQETNREQVRCGLCTGSLSTRLRADVGDLL